MRARYALLGSEGQIFSKGQRGHVQVARFILPETALLESSRVRCSQVSHLAYPEKGLGLSHYTA
jgi:hypothetical protein